MTTWTTKEGYELEIKDMASSHLLATIHYIERSRFMNAAECMVREPKNVDYYMQWHPQYESLIKEAQRRNLIWRNEPGLVKKRNNK